MSTRGDKRWLPLEANPELIEKYANTLSGNNSLKFHDILSTESWAIEMIPQPVVAVLLLFPMKKETESIRNDFRENKLISEGHDQNLCDVWFTHQTVSNACGTVAVLHILANIVKKSNCNDSSFIHSFLKTVEGKSAEEIGKELENNEEIEKAHSIVEREGQSNVPSKDDEVQHHFIAFIEKNGSLIELDGDKHVPFSYGKTTPESFLNDSVDVVKKHFVDIDVGEVRFQLIAATLT